MKIKNYIWVVLIIGLIGIPAMAQKRRPETSKRTRVSRVPTSQHAAPAQSLSAAERTAALDTSISSTCAETAPTTPKTLTHNTQVFSPQRIASTLNGVWIGKVSGEYDPQLFAADGFLNVDYYMIVDINRGESFVYQEFGSNRSGAGLQAQPGAPKWTYVWCARENYETKSPRQIHDFVKVSDNIQDGKQLLTNSTGLTFAPGEQLVLSNAWQKLVAAKFFDDPKRSLAYAGVLFKPITMGTVQSAGGGSLFELRLVGEYRGSGETAAKFIPGEPIHNVEQAHFLGLTGSGTSTASASPSSTTARTAVATTTESSFGDFLVAAFGIGNAMIGPKDDATFELFSTQMAFDKVVIGPLGTGSLTPGVVTAPAAKAAPAKARTTRAARGQR